MRGWLKRLWRRLRPDHRIQDYTQWAWAHAYGTGDHEHVYLDGHIYPGWDPSGDEDAATGD